MNEWLIFCVDPHDYFNRAFWTLRSYWHYVNGLNVANRKALQINRLSGTKTFSIVKMSDERNFFGEQPTRPADEENEEGKGHRTDDYGYPNLEFRPPELLLT